MTTALRDLVYAAQARTLQLDAEQLRVLDMAGANARVHVRGAAGTGKTVVARELCMRRAATGARVRYLCFTDALARAVDRSFDEARRGGLDVRAHAIRRLAVRVAGVPEPGDGPSWDHALARAAEQASARMGPVDLTVVDEAQDLSAADWRLVRAVADDGPLWLFSDPDQRFWVDRNIPPELASLPVLELPVQQRLPPGIETLARHYLPDGPRMSDAEPTPDVQVLVTPPEQTLQRLDREITALLSRGIAPRHVAVLTLAGRSRSRILGTPSLGGVTAVAADDDAMADHLVLDTALRFKGLERAVVFICELAMAGAQHHHDVRMHIALTRALARVFILATPTALDADPRLAALVPR